MSWGIADLTLSAVNEMAARFGSLLRLHNRDGSIVDDALSANIPRLDVTSLKQFVPVLGAQAGTFSATIASTSYAVSGSGLAAEMLLSAHIEQASVSATPAHLSIAIPAGWFVSESMMAGAAVHYLDGAGGTTPGTGVVIADAGRSRTELRVFRDFNATAWGTSVALTFLTFQIRFRVRK